MLHGLAREGVLVPAAVAPAPLTLPSHGSILTGLVPRRHGSTDNGLPLAASNETLAERLGALGWATAAFVSGYPLVRAFGLDQGFVHYDDTLLVDGRERRAPDTVGAALDWLSERDGERVFVWVHLYDPHDPYEAPGTPSGATTASAYHAEARYADAALAPLVAAFRARGALVIATADHGEGLGEHGEATHGLFLNESTIAVPLVFWWPGHVSPRVVEQPLALVGIAPTVLDLLGLPALDGVDGASLSPWLRGAADAAPPVLIESERAWRSYGWAPLSALRSGQWKLVRGSRPTLHDLAADGDSRDVLDDHRRVAGAMARTLRQELAKPRVSAGGGDALEAEALAQLAALGYAGAGQRSLLPPQAVSDLADPRDRLRTWERLSQALALAESGRGPEARELFDAVLAEDPDNPFALSRSGALLAEAGRTDEGIARLRRALTLRAEDAETRLVLARLLEQAGRHLHAAREWGRLVEQRPRDQEAWFGLARASALGGDRAASLTALRQLYRLDPLRDEVVRLLAAAEEEGGDRCAAAAVLADATLRRPGLTVDPSLLVELARCKDLLVACDLLVRLEASEAAAAAVEALAGAAVATGGAPERVREAVRRWVKEHPEIAPWLGPRARGLRDDAASR